MMGSSKNGIRELCSQSCPESGLLQVPCVGSENSAIKRALLSFVKITFGFSAAPKLFSPPL